MVRTRDLYGALVVTEGLLDYLGDRKELHLEDLGWMREIRYEGERASPLEILIVINVPSLTTISDELIGDAFKGIVASDCGLTRYPEALEKSASVTHIEFSRCPGLMGKTPSFACPELEHLVVPGLDSGWLNMDAMPKLAYLEREFYEDPVGPSEPGSDGLQRYSPDELEALIIDHNSKMMGRLPRSSLVVEDPLLKHAPTYFGLVDMLFLVGCGELETMVISTEYALAYVKAARCPKLREVVAPNVRASEFIDCPSLVYVVTETHKTLLSANCGPSSAYGEASRRDADGPGGCVSDPTDRAWRKIEYSLEGEHPETL